MSSVSRSNAVSASRRPARPAAIESVSPQPRRWRPEKRARPAAPGRRFLRHGLLEEHPYLRGRAPQPVGALAVHEGAVGGEAAGRREPRGKGLVAGIEHPGDRGADVLAQTVERLHRAAGRRVDRGHGLQHRAGEDVLHGGPDDERIRGEVIAARDDRARPVGARELVGLGRGALGRAALDVDGAHIHHVHQSGLAEAPGHPVRGHAAEGLEGGVAGAVDEHRDRHPVARRPVIPALATDQEGNGDARRREADGDQHAPARHRHPPCSFPGLLGANAGGPSLWFGIEL